MQKNDIISVTAQALGTNGEGIVKTDGFTLFVPYLLPGERASVRILKVKDNIAYGKIEEVEIPAEERVRPRCPVFYRCGGCRLQHIKYRPQLRFKTDLVRDALRKIGGIETEVNFCERSEKEYGYRNKLQMPIGRLDGENAIGFYAERTHRIVKTDECPIHPEWSKPLIEALYNFMEKCGLDGYDEETGEGQLRHIVVRELKNKYIITLVSTVREIKGIDYLYFLLDKIFPAYSFFLSFNDKKTNVIFGEDPVLLRGKESYDCVEGGIVYSAGALTFLQVNEGVRTKLYERAVSLIGEEDTVIDCYAGGGLLTAMFAQKGKFAYGIEVVKEASACADAIALRNGLEGKMKNLCGRVEDVLPDLLEREKHAVVVFDPPRSGVDRETLKTVIRSGAERILMISCNPATLARDVGFLMGTLTETEHGELVKSSSPLRYDVELVQPFDMFPQTKHVETLLLLHKRAEG